MREIFLVALSFILLDIVSGILAAVVNEELNSSKMRKGLYHKIAEIVLMALGVVGQYASTVAGLDGIVPDAVFQSVIVYVIVMELVSILENVCKANPNLKLASLLAMFGREEENNGDE